MSKISSLLLLVSLLLGSGLVMAQEANFTPVFTETDCPAEAADNLRCGYVDVPEFHADPTGETIRLSVTVIESAGDAPDPLVMFNGGPGSDILNFLPTMNSAMAAPITDARDVVLMSERGSFGATPLLTCPELSAISNQYDLDLDTLNTQKTEALLACRARLIAEGVDLNAYNNPERAADVPMVMQALGYDSYNLWGVSGGGIMAQYVLRNHPAGVRTVMTDSGAFPTTYLGTVFFNIYEIVSDAYRRLFATCAADPVCSSTYPDLENVYWGLVDQLNATPAPVQFTDPATGAVYETELTGEMVVSILSNQFANAEIMPRVIYALAAGDYSYITTRLPELYVTDIDYADALYQSVVCSETAGLTQDTASTATAYPQVVDAIEKQVEFFIDVCAGWDVNAVPESAPLVSDTPILIMEGAFDSNKPPQLGAAVAENFSTSYLVEFADTAHGVFGACALLVMADFMDDPTTAPDTGCVPTTITFALPGSELTFTETALDDIGISVLLPDGWTPVDNGTYANPVDGSILLVTAFPGDDIEATLTEFTNLVGLPPLTKLGDVPVGTQAWAIYQVMDGDTGTMIAATSHNGNIYLVGLQTAASQLEAGSSSILEPIVGSLTFLD